MLMPLPVDKFYEQNPAAISSVARVIGDALAMAPSLEGKSVLDIGCGRGSLCAEAAQRGASKTVGIDVTSLALELARQIAGKHDVRLIRGRAESLPVRTGEFDVVFCTEVLEHVSDADQCLREMFRVLKAGGECVLSHPNYFNFLYIQKRLGDLRLRRVNQTSAYPLGWTPWGRPAPIERYYNPYDLRRRFFRSGFVVKQVRCTYYLFAVERWLPSCWRTELYRSRFDKFVAPFFNRLPILRYFGYKLHWRLQKR